MTLVIAAIVAAIILVMFNKQQDNKISNNLYADDVQQLYLLTAAEYKINALENQHMLNNETIVNNAAPPVEEEIAQLTKAFNEGKIQLSELNAKLDNLLNECSSSGQELSKVF